MKLFSNLLKKNKIKGFMKVAEAYEQDNDLEQAYEAYCQAAELGSTEAMFAIGMLYFDKQFRMVETNNLMQLMLQGIPAFPWNTKTNLVPDFKTGLEWFRQAADLGMAKAWYMMGCCFCEGIGCEKNIADGVAYLEQAANAGMQAAEKVLNLYRPTEERQIPDGAYEQKLQEFVRAADAGDQSKYKLYEELRSGNQRQLARLGYVLTAAHNINKQNYEEFPSAYTASGLPLVPVYMKRGNWKSVLRFDLNSLPSEQTLIAISSDIYNFLEHAYGLRRVGEVVYRSPEFGWLGEEKHAILFQIDHAAKPEGYSLSELASDFCLKEEEYKNDHTAFLTECGEKEYSVEIAAITGIDIDILLRYTIGGSEHVTEYFAPKLISMTML